MRISCPNCHFEKDVDPKKIPSTALNATCPKCGQRFPISIKQDEPVFSAPPPPDKPEQPLKPASAPVSSPKPNIIKPQQHRATYHGKNSTLLSMYLVNNLLAVLTLGIYYFWGKVKIRKYLFSSTEFMGERFSFTGTGKELFIGWLKAAIVMFLAFGAPQMLSAFVHPFFGFLVMPMVLVIMPIALVATRRYRLSRTVWHGVRFSFDGSIKEFIKIHIRGTILTFITLGFYSPYFHVQKEKFWRSHSRYGTDAFKYAGEGRDLRREFLKAVLLFIPTLGIYTFWYKANVMRYDWEKTTFGNLSFRSTVTGGKLFFFLMGNMLLLVFTLGLGYPWLISRAIRFASDNLVMTGSIEFERLGQTAQSAQAVGEAMSGLFDMDIAM